MTSMVLGDSKLESLTPSVNTPLNSCPTTNSGIWLAMY